LQEFEIDMTVEVWDWQDCRSWHCFTRFWQRST